MRSLYATLGIDRRATAKEVKRAYYAAAHDCHPDKCPNDPEAAQRFSDISLAYTVLADPSSRRRYDLLGPVALGLSPAMTDLSILGADGERLAQALGHVVGGVVGRLRRKRKADAAIDVHIDVACALRGGTQEVRMQRQIVCATCNGKKNQPASKPADPKHKAPALMVRCAHCRGQGTVNHTAVWQLRIPKDSGPQDILRMRSAGPMGQDLMVQLRIGPHPLLLCRHLDLFVEMVLRPSAAVLGGVVALPMPHKTIAVTVPPGTQSGDRLTLADEGLKGAKRNQRGQLHITFEVEVPAAAALGPQHLAAWRTLAECEGREPHVFAKSRRFAENMQH